MSQDGSADLDDQGTAAAFAADSQQSAVDTAGTTANGQPAAAAGPSAATSANATTATAGDEHTTAAADAALITQLERHGSLESVTLLSEESEHMSTACIFPRVAATAPLFSCPVVSDLTIAHS